MPWNYQSHVRQMQDAAPDMDITCRRALKHYGTEHQKLIAIEEMSELTKELCKDSRGVDNHAELVDEIADVTICLRQLVNHYDCQAEVNERIKFKLKRLWKRMDEDGEEGGKDAD